MAFSKQKSKYFMVKGNVTNDGLKWFANIHKQDNKSYENERKAAIEVDKWLITQGREPKNILKRL